LNIKSELPKYRAAKAINPTEGETDDAGEIQWHSETKVPGLQRSDTLDGQVRESMITSTQDPTVVELPHQTQHPFPS
jgi:hypothetical protein